jgi:hypothetical protein
MLRRRLEAVLIGSAVLLSACGTEPSSFDVTEVPGTLLDAGADGSASGVLDGGSMSDGGSAGSQDGGSSSTPDGSPSLDVSLPPDSGVVSPDTGGGADPEDPEPDATGGGTDSDPGPELVCEPGTTECAEGDILVTCSDDGTEVGRIRCAARGAVCGEDGAGNAACLEAEPVCEPGAERCSPDGEGIEECNEAGTAFVLVATCGIRCNPLGGAECIGGEEDVEDPGDPVDPVDPPVCDLEDFPLLTAGVQTFDLCDGDDNYSNLEAEGCGFEYEGNDRAFALVLTAATEVTLDVRDDDDSVAVDTVLYLRETCNDQESQIACDDDVPCDQSTVDTGGCVNGTQPRQSRVTRLLEAGTYYVIVDQYSYTSRRTGTRFQCGEVRLEVTFE